MKYHFIELDFHPDQTALISKLGLEPDSDEAEDFAAILDKVAPLSRPKAAIGSAPVENVDANGRVVLAGIEFKSALLAKNLTGVTTAWPYLATCGREMYDFAAAMADPFERYWVEEIMQAALTEVRGAMLDYLAGELYDGKTAAMGPGSLEEWPISQQTPLFRLLGDAPSRCGVLLTDTLLMLPNKSVSGILFPNEHGYVNCRLCPRDNCPNRKADYDPSSDMM